MTAAGTTRSGRDASCTVGGSLAKNGSGEGGERGKKSKRLDDTGQEQGGKGDYTSFCPRGCTLLAAHRVYIGIYIYMYNILVSGECSHLTLAVRSLFSCHCRGVVGGIRVLKLLKTTYKSISLHWI